VALSAVSLTDMGGKAKGQRVRKAREGVGLTQEGLARKLGVSRTTVLRWEKGSFSPRFALEKLARVCRVRVAWLAFGEGEPAAQTEPGSAAV
jgi:transcriptional regulator with XRE-family HTH domain